MSLIVNPNTTENLIMAEVLLDIAQNASIRGMRVDGEDRFSVLDFITYVCPGRNSSYANFLKVLRLLLPIITRLLMHARALSRCSVYFNVMI
jgi:hypothetical protein